MLFSKEKDLVLKFTNLILVLWLAAGLTILQYNLIELIFEPKEMNYSDYSDRYCQYLNSEKNDCEKSYSHYLLNSDNRDIKNIVLSLGNVLIVGSTILILNKRRVRK